MGHWDTEEQCHNNWRGALALESLEEAQEALPKPKYGHCPLCGGLLIKTNYAGFHPFEMYEQLACIECDYKYLIHHLIS